MIQGNESKYRVKNVFIHYCFDFYVYKKQLISWGYKLFAIISKGNNLQ